MKPLHVLTPESVQKLKKDDDVLNHHQISISDGAPPSLAVHFSNGVFRELDRCALPVKISDVDNTRLFYRLLLFSCKKVTYVWDEGKNEFVKLKGLDQDVSADVLHCSKGLTSNEQFMR